MKTFEAWENQLQKLYKTYSNFCEDVEFLKESAATKDEVLKLEKSICRDIPKSLRDTLLFFSKNIYFFASLPNDFELPPELSGIFSATFTISLDEIIDAEENRKLWVKDCFNDTENEYDKVWHNKLGFMTVPNGDVIAFDLDDSKEDKRVVYLSHDGDKSHGVVLGENFKEYFSNLLLIGGCGNEDWQMMPFVDSKTGLSADCKNANTYRKLIGLN